ncbi:phosphonopyruvate decarboxylase [Bowmanella denitrificans]|uniref:Phosphonopyruvate decarboxylase n=1 Tax=Bowmanella denitrificans TaxID=366582 RepID=A0ABN0XLF9_9ALTE
MIAPSEFCQLLDEHGMSSFYGVPDSLLKSFCAYVDSYYPSSQHIITANEGNAVAMAAGHYLGSGKAAVVYMQNSGLGNAINPLTSLADPQVYGIPMLLIIGWRGEPGVKDEPQHVKQGAISEQQLSLMGIDYLVVDADSDWRQKLPILLTEMKTQSKPVAILVRKNGFADFKGSNTAGLSIFGREAAIECLVSSLSADALIVSTTGKTSRELFEIRQRRGEGSRDFLTVGAMGHTLSIAAGVASTNPNRLTVALDGDGSALMHMGSLAVIGSKGPGNLLHVLLNNSCHESVGGQATVADKVDWHTLSKACGYRQYYCVDSEQELKKALDEVSKSTGPQLLEILIAKGSRDDLGRPTSSPQQNKLSFMLQVGST